MNIINDIYNPQPNIHQVLFPVDHSPYIDQRHKNMEIARVYTTIINDVRSILSKMVIPQHRTYIMSRTPVTEPYDQVIFEFVCVLGCLTLSAKEYCYIIELETDCDIVKITGDFPYRKMIRAAYRATMWDFTQYTIEDSLIVDTMKLDHYTYFKNRLKDKVNTDIIFMDEEPVVE